MVFCKIFIARNKVEMYVFPMTHPTNHNTVQTRTQQAAPDIDGFSQSMFSQNIKQMQFLEKNYEAYNSSADYAFVNRKFQNVCGYCHRVAYILMLGTQLQVFLCEINAVTEVQYHKIAGRSSL